jgi:tRNA threonylcarbamoyladenosine biosynthesis protein TsaE
VRRETKNLEETHDVAKDFVASLNALARNGQMGDGAIVVGMSGDLGSGKTSFVQGIAKHLGVKDKIISPTFVIQKRYPLKDHTYFKNLAHIDAYRLEKPEEILKIGWYDLTKEKRNIIFIEWPEKIGPLLPKDHKKIIFEFVDPDKRLIDLIDIE